ncbi:MBL fold metallo-hydrolase [Flavobacterium sp. RHBU_24]|uniref:MBL fold metallo-hydrolase n=1 Tax=Flavobacterium sp. RHBU_24 TaxID=3391185 RepID=UPI003984C93B
MNVWFLGTGTSQGIPIIGSTHPVCLSDNPRDKRLRVSVWLYWEGSSYVIDCGPDFRQQMLTCGCNRIDGILYTHEHADHTAGLDDIRPFFFRQGDIPIYAKDVVIESLKKRFDYIFTEGEKYPGVPNVVINEVRPDAPFVLGGKVVTPIRVNHGRIEILGYRIGNFAYLTDVKTVSESELEKLVGLKVLVVSALRIDPHDSHMNLDEALAFIAGVKPEKAYLTHISHLLGFHEQVEQSLPKNVFLAYDNLQISIE